MKLNNEQKVLEVMRLTGKGKMACEINLSLTDWSIDKAIKRMRVTYPSMIVKVEK